MPPAGVTPAPSAGGATHEPPDEPDARPRPQYGEYATPEEQRARIQRPETTGALETGQDPRRRLVDPAPPAGPDPGTSPEAPDRCGRPRRHGRSARLRARST